MSLTLIIAIIGIGAVLFGGYIFYSISSHKSGSTASSVSTETKEELELISKMQKQQLIKDQKQIQDLVQKNAIFKRSYENKVANQQNNLNSISSSHQEQELLNQEEIDYVDVEQAATISSDAPDYDNGYNYGYDTEDFESDYAARSIDLDQEQEELSEIELNEINSLGDSLKNINSQYSNTAKETEHESVVIQTPELEDDYTEEQQWMIKHVYNTYVSANIK